MEAALRTRTRKVAWKASSASWWRPRTRQQTPQTIRPCRCTRAARADSWRVEVAVQELPVAQAGFLGRERGIAEGLQDLRELVGCHRPRPWVGASVIQVPDGDGIDR